MQHSKQYSTIRRRPYINWYTKHKEIIEIISVAVVAAAIVLMICTWYNRAYAENYQQVHKCIETYKAINQDKVKPLYDVAQCTHNPYIIT